MKSLLSICLIFIAFSVLGQTDSIVTVDTTLNYELTQVNKKAEFPGGEQALMKFIAQHLKYPLKAIENDIEGTVIMQFVVNTDGSISDIAPVGDKRFGFGLEDECIRVIKSMPAWSPASIKGKNVKMQFRLPIKFKIYGEPKKKPPVTKRKIKSTEKELD